VLIPVTEPGTSVGMARVTKRPAKAPRAPTGREALFTSSAAHKVMLDRDLAELYGVRPIALRQQVKRNKIRFPDGGISRPAKYFARAVESQV
jgi:ORF6N domain